MARERKERRERRMNREDFGDSNLRMTAPRAIKQWAAKNNKVLRFVNDDKARISQLVGQDWDFVKYEEGQIEESVQEMGSGYSIVVGNKENGEPLKAYLMAKEKDWYQDDQKMKQQAVDEVDEEIRGGKLVNVEQSYQPKDGSGRTVTKYKP